MQLDWSDAAEPIELEFPAREPQWVALTDPVKNRLAETIANASAHERAIIEEVLRRYASDLRHVSHGLWPDKLSLHGRSVDDTEVTPILDKLAALGFVVKRPGDFYVSTSWLTEYADGASIRTRADARS